MLILETTTDSLQVLLSNNILTSQLDCTASFRETSATTFDFKSSDIATNDVSAVTLVSAPPANTQRVIDEVRIYNNDTTINTVLIRYNRNGVFRLIFRATLAPQESIIYTDKNGWGVYTADGAVKQSYIFGSSPITSTLSSVILSNDVINNNPVANTLQDVTGFNFPVTAGGTYYFRFIFRYDVATFTTGSRWALGGASVSSLAYQAISTLGGTSMSFANGNALDLAGSASANSANASGNLGTLEGIATASASGVLTLRFASEVASSAITVRAGSVVYWQQIA